MVSFRPYWQERPAKRSACDPSQYRFDQPDLRPPSFTDPESSLLTRRFYRLQKVNPGFSYEHLTSFSVALPEKKYKTNEQQEDFYNRLLENLRSLPGVEATAAASGLPLGNNGWQTGFVIDGRPRPPRNETPLMEACLVTTDYFRAMNIPLKSGRYFTDRDDRSFLAGKDLSKLTDDEKEMAGLNAVIIDEEFARRYWPNEEAVGKRIKMGSEEKPLFLTVQGVVGRVKMDGLSQDSKRVQGYFPFLQIPSGGMTVIVKGSADPNQLVGALREQVRQILPQVFTPDLPASPSEYATFLSSLDCFETPSLGVEDFERTKMYQTERSRNEVLDLSGDVERWLESLQIRVRVAPLRRESLARAAQLLNKTNQMNLRTRRLSELEAESVHLVVTSPPYWTLKEYRDSQGQMGHIEDYEEFLTQLDKVWSHCFRSLVPGGRLICVVGDVCLSRRKNNGRHTVVPLHASIQEHCRKLGFDNLAPIIWHKIANAVYEVENGSGSLTNRTRS